MFDASSLVGAAIRRGSVPERAFQHALEVDTIALSRPVLAELLEVLYRPRLARFIDEALRADVLVPLRSRGVVFEPAIRVTDCRGAKDNKYLELALAADAAVIVGSDGDLLVLDPWRERSVLTAAAYLAGVIGLPKTLRLRVL